MNKPVAWINVEKRKLEWANPTLWETPTVVKLDRIPLYTHPVELTDEEIVEIGENTLPNEAIGFVPTWQWIDFARAILRKAQEK